jgi:CBS domain-containing protein
MAHSAHPDPHDAADLDELDFDLDPDLEGDERPAEGRRAERRKVFDDALLRESVKVLPARQPIVLSGEASVTDAVRAMQRGHRGAVVVTEDGTPNTRLVGIFTERDVLLRIVDRGRNPATLRLAEVMTRDPERLPLESSVAWALNKMSIGGFRHVPVVDEDDRPVFVVSVRDVVELLVQSFPGEVLNLPVEYGADRQRTREGA